MEAPKYLEEDIKLSLYISITPVPSTDTVSIYEFKTQWSDTDKWNPSSKTRNNISVGSTSVLLDILNTAVLTFCNEVILVVEDSVLKEHLQILTGQIKANNYRKNKAFDFIIYNPKEKTDLSRLFQMLNVSVI